MISATRSVMARRHSATANFKLAPVNDAPDSLVKKQSYQWQRRHPSADFKADLLQGYSDVDGDGLFVKTFASKQAGSKGQLNKDYSGNWVLNPQLITQDASTSATR